MGDKMPYVYRKTGFKAKERVEETVEMLTVGAQPSPREGLFTIINFVLTGKVKKSINGEAREVNDKITVFPDQMNGLINFARDMPEVAKEIDEMTRDKKPCKVKVRYYVNELGDKRAKIKDIEKWEIVR